MIRKLFFAVILTLTYYSGFSQTVLKGKVISEDSKLPLPSVSVYINNTTLGAVTNDQGQFLIDHIPQGKFKLASLRLSARKKIGSGDKCVAIFKIG